MKRLSILALLASTATVGLSGNANAGPSLNGSFCTPDTTPFTCQIFEGEEDVGEWTQIQLPVDTTDGWVVLLESGGSTDPSNWSDVAHWFDGKNANGQVVQFLDFFSDPLDPALFSLAAGAFFIPEDPSGVTLWDVGNQYFFHSDAEVVPEPASIGLIGAALLSLLGFAGLMRRRSDA